MKKILFIMVFVLFGFLCISKVDAGSLSISGNNSAYVNSSITVTINFNNIAGRFRIYSSDSSVLSGGAEEWYENQKATVTFKATKAGTATITVAPVGNVGDYDAIDYKYTGGSRALTVKVINRSTPPSIDVNRTYNKNNYLNSLSISGYEISPSFDKETLEYTVELNPGEEKININATVEDKTAHVKGIGEVSVSEGINTLNIIVTAENGNERTYIIKANVEEKDPIEVNINDKKYRVVKKEELIPDKDGYKKIKININNFEVPALYNEITKITLVGLKDSNGDINLYYYDSTKGEYGEYKELKFDLMNLYIQEKNNSKYAKTIIKINGVEVPAYKLNGLDEYYLIYATNTSTGNVGYYLYDIKENSVQRYNAAILDVVTKEKDKYLALVIVLSVVCFLSMLFLLIEVNKDSKKSED